jgi:hypothetical protein
MITRQWGADRGAFVQAKATHTWRAKQKTAPSSVIQQALRSGRKKRRGANEDRCLISIGGTTIQITVTAADSGDPVQGRYVIA